MIHLVKKDFLLQKNFYWFAFGYTFFIFIVFNNPVFMNLKYIMGGTILAYIFILSTFSYEEKNGTDIILNSLPLTRKKIIRAKYLMFLCATAMSLLIVAIIGFLFYLFPVFPEANLINFTDILAVFCSIILLISIHFPLYIRFGSKYTRYFNIILFMLVFFTPGFITGYIKENPDFALLQFLSGVSVTSFLSIVLIFLSFIFLISYKKALDFYEQKDF